MSKVFIFLAEGFEEVEALTVVDILRRAKIDIQTVSIGETKEVMSSHHVTVVSDILFSEINEMADAIVLPGGIPGTPNLRAHKGLRELIISHKNAGKFICAICAAPSVYGEMKLLDGKNAACYPGFEDKLIGANVVFDKVAVDGKFITSRGLGTAMEFAFTIVENIMDKETADRIKKAIIY